MKTKYIPSFCVATAVAVLSLSLVPGARANDWTGSTGWWHDAANWNGGVPDVSGGWAIGNIGNGGVAYVGTAVPHVSEAWAGNNGTAGTIIITNGGTLSVDNWLVVSRYGSGGNTPLSTLIVGSGGVLNKTGDGFLIGDFGNCKGQMFVTGNGQVNISGGWNGIGNGTPGGEGWLYLQDNAVYTLVAQDWNVGDYGAGRGHAYIKDNATLNVSRFFVGKNDSAIGALWQTGGTINGTGNNANEWTIGGDATASVNAFGFYSLSAGTLTCPYNFQVGRNGTGLLYQSGGTNTQSGWCDTARYPTGLGVTWLTGGLLQHLGTGTRYFVAEQGRGEVAISGTGILDTAVNIVIGGTGSATGFLSLNSGGTLRVPGIDKWGGAAYLNFNGGTLRAKQSNPSFMVGNLAEARVYAGNAIIDTAGYDVAIAQPLLGVSGNGVASIPILDGGAGYMAPPAVQISGDGFGAQAVAQINPASGTVTNIVIVCPGHDYSFATPTLIGGGPSTAASVNTANLTPVSSGGLVKNGAGILTLTAANSYTGATVVNAGALVTTTASTGGGVFNIADNAEFDVTLHQPGAQLTASSLALGTSTGATLDLDLGSFGNPAFAPINVAGSLAVNGTVTVNVADGFPQVGSLPLIHFGSRTGVGSLALGNIPLGIQAHLATNIPNSTIDLVVTAVSLPRWDGQAGGSWDIHVTTNWTDLSSGLPSYYLDGSSILFDDAALGTTTVNLVTDVLPGKISINNSTMSYSLIGTGKVGGATGLIKQGANTFTIANSRGNDYTGPTVILNGTLAVTNLANGGVPSAIGASPSAAANLVLSNGTLSYSGPPVSINRGYSVRGASSGIDAESDLAISGVMTATAGSSLVKSGPGKLAYKTVGANELSGGAFPGYNILNGTVVFDGTAGGQTNHNQNEFWVGSTPDVAASLILSNTTLNIDSWFAVGRGNGSSGTASSATLYNSHLNSGSASLGYDNGRPNLANPVLTLNGNSTFTNNGDMNLGESGGSTASVFLNGTSKLYANWRLFIGWHGSATGAVTVADSAFLGVNAWLSIGNEGGSGTMLLKNNANLWVLWDLNITDVNTGYGLLTIQDTAYAEANNVYVAKGAGSTGLLNQTGGTVHTRPNNSEFHVGSHGTGTYNLSAGVVNSDGNWTSIGRYSDGLGVLNVSGGNFNHNDTGKLLQVGEEGNGTLNVSGTGVVTANGDRLQIASSASATGVINLNGGTIIARRVAGNNGFSTFNFNGGLLKAAPNAHSDFMSAISIATVSSGGAVIDSGTNNIAISQPLADAGGGGGLTKLGTGSLVLNGMNSYSGTTRVSAGTLGGDGVIQGPVAVASGAIFSPGTSIGLLTINSTLVLSNGSTTLMEMNKQLGTNDEVVGLSTVTYGGTLVLKNLGGTLVAGDTFKLFDASTSYTGVFSSVVSATPGQNVTWDTSKLTTDGTVKVATATAAPATLSASASGGNLTLSWPTNQVGWRLLAQSNAKPLGLNTNWTEVPGSSNTNQMTVPIDKTRGSVFYRLVFP